MKVTLILVLIACVSAGCSTTTVSGSNSGTSPASADPREAVINASKKLMALKSLKGNIESTGSTAFKQQVEYAGPDRYRVSYYDQTGAELDMVIVGDKTYIKSGDSWNELPNETDPTPTMRNSFTDDVLQTLSDAKFEGEDSVNSRPVFVYSYKLVTKIGNFPVTQRIWVDQFSGVPIKCFVEYTEGSIKTLTTTFDTESPVSIDFPVK